MSEYTRIVVGDHGAIYVEIESTEGWRDAGFKEQVDEIQVQFEQIMEAVHTTALGFRDGLCAMAEETRPDEATLEFGLALGGEVGVAIKASGEAALKVSLTWKNLNKGNGKV